MASRKRKPLSIKEKLNILAVVDRNPKRKRIDIANELGLPASTVNIVVSKRKEIETNALVFGGATKQARGARHGELEEALLKWLKQARACVNTTFVLCFYLPTQLATCNRPSTLVSLRM
ncbi:hypothetical protein MTO96_000475 [Rhipicephalus appendiculatus]